MSNPPSVLLSKEEAIEAKENNLFVKDSKTSIHAVPSRGVTGTTSRLSFVP